MRATGTDTPLPEAVSSPGFAPPRAPGPSSPSAPAPPPSPAPAPPPSRAPAPAPQPPARASDSDREHTVALLHEHWLAGRLTLPELETRSEQAWSARLVSELWNAVRELPVPVLSAPPPAREPRGSRGVVAFVLGVIGMCLLILSFGMLCFIALPLTAGAWVSGRRARRRDRGRGAGARGGGRDSGRRGHRARLPRAGRLGGDPGPGLRRQRRRPCARIQWSSTVKGSGR